TVVAVIGDDNVAKQIDGNPLRIVQRGFISRDAITLVSGRAVSSIGGDDSRWIHFADPLVNFVGDVHIPRTVHCDAGWVQELGAGSGPAIAAVATRIGSARKSRNHAAAHLAD